MDTTEAFLKLIKEFAQKGHISEIEMTILNKKANEIGIENSALEALIDIELSNTSNSNITANNKVDDNKDGHKQNTYKGTWWSRSGGIEDAGFGGLTIAADDGGGCYDLRWLDKDKAKIKITCNTVNEIEIITEMELFEIKNDSFQITTKDALFILENIHEDKEEWEFEEWSLKKELLTFFDKFIQENLKVKLRNEVEEKIENIKIGWKKKEEEETKSTEKKQLKKYKWESRGLHHSTINYNDDHIILWLSDGVVNGKGEAIMFSRANSNNVQVNKGKFMDDKWDTETLEKNTKIEIIQFKPGILNIITQGSQYTFTHEYVATVAKFMKDCKNYFPEEIIQEDSEIEVKVKESEIEHKEWLKKWELREEKDQEAEREKSKQEREDEREKGMREQLETDDGKKYNGDSFSKKWEISNVKHEFSSSATRGGDVINPDRIIIDGGKVIWKKRSKLLIGGESISIPIDKVSSVELNSGIIGTDIVIMGNGYSSIHAKDFTKSDAQRIQSLLGF